MYKKFEILQKKKKNLAGARECDGGTSRPVTQLQTRSCVSKSCRAPSKGTQTDCHHELCFSSCGSGVQLQTMVPHQTRLSSPARKGRFSPVPQIQTQMNLRHFLFNSFLYQLFLPYLISPPKPNRDHSLQLSSPTTRPHINMPSIRRIFSKHHLVYFILLTFTGIQCSSLMYYFAIYLHLHIHCNVEGICNPFSISYTEQCLLLWLITYKISTNVFIKYEVTRQYCKKFLFCKNSWQIVKQAN